MLQITFSSSELYNDRTGQFFDIQGGTFSFEHSLLSVSKWEYKYCKPFLTDQPEYKKTTEEWLYYFKCMCTDSRFETALITVKEQKQLLDYIALNQTATRLSPKKPDPSRSGSFISSELLYANMANSQIPFTADRWPLSRLMALLGIISEQNTDPKERKQSVQETREMQKHLNAERRVAMKSKG